MQDLLAISYSLAAQRRPVGYGHETVVTSDINEEIRQDILGVVAELRGLVGELRPPGLTEFGLKAVLEGYVAALNRRDGNEMPAIVIDFEEMPQLPQPLAVTTFRIVQEALRNAIRHSAANEVTIHLSCHCDELLLHVVDDGQGFSLPTRMNELADCGHFGLIGLVERVDQAQGTIDIAAEPGTGTEINVKLPVNSLREQYAGLDSGRTRR